VRIAIGSDHAGFELKESVKAYLESEGHAVSDLGTYDEEAVDYPDYAQAVAEAVAAGEARFGVLVCGSGLGMEIAANKVKGVRAVQVIDEEFAKMARLHNDANVLTLAGRYTDEMTARRIVDTFLTTPFEGEQPDGGRHQRRVDKISGLEKS
jgi:ribose 5-phosphate isomerase B